MLSLPEQIDADIALALQQQESPQRTVPSRSRAIRPVSETVKCVVGLAISY